jgi:hypothetical protein
MDTAMEHRPEYLTGEGGSDCGVRLQVIDRARSAAVSAPCPTFGFTIHLAAADDLHAWLADFIESRGLVWRRAAADEYIVTGEGTQATHDDREAVARWLAEHGRANEFQISPLGDVQDASW